MSIFKAITTIVSTPVRCLGELGKDLETLVDDRNDEIEVIGGGILCTKRDAYKLAKEKLEERENKEFN